MDGGARGLALRRAILRHADAVIHAVANQVHQGIAELIDDRLIELRIGSFDGQFHVFAQIARQVVHQAAKPLEGAADRQHAHIHRVFAQGRGQPIDFFGDCAYIGIVAARGKFTEPGLHGDQFSDQIHKLIELCRGDANAAAVVG